MCVSGLFTSELRGGEGLCVRLRSLTSELRGGEGRVCVCVSGLSFREPALFSLMSSLEPARPEGG